MFRLQPKPMIRV